MSEKIITQKDVEHVAKLARIAISSEEKVLVQEQLERILGYIAKLKEKNTGDASPMAHPFESSNVWREDVAKPFSDIPALFKNAPDMEETFFKVKKVIE